jgi:serine/threonine-protein kinase TTK/MPS1
MECGETDFSSLLDEQRGKPLNMNFVALYWQQVSNKQLPFPEIVDNVLPLQMLEAVQAVHEQKVVHSDLKPANFVLVKGRLKIIDFGIAKAIANDTVNIQRDVQVRTAGSKIGEKE